MALDDLMTLRGSYQSVTMPDGTEVRLAGVGCTDAAGPRPRGHLARRGPVARVLVHGALESEPASGRSLDKEGVIQSA